VGKTLARATVVALVAEVARITASPVPSKFVGAHIDLENGVPEWFKPEAIELGTREFAEYGLTQASADTLHDDFSYAVEVRGGIRRLSEHDEREVLDPKMNVTIGFKMYETYGHQLSRIYPGTLDDEDGWRLAYMRFSIGGARMDRWLGMVGRRLTISLVADRLADLVRQRVSGATNVEHELEKMTRFAAASGAWV
jgi:hypothetical protein